MEIFHANNAGFDMSSDDFVVIYRESWEEDFNYLFVARTKKKDEGKITFDNENKNTYIEGTPETQPFKGCVRSRQPQPV